ncbi:MAG: hypothetical protein AB7E05_00180 [Sphingobium sp.]
MTVRMEAVAQPVIEAALAETKAWLRIEMTQDDEAIAALCRSAIGMAEDFCAQRLFARQGVEVMAASREWRRLRACPVRGIAAVRALAVDGTATALPADGYALDIDGNGDGWVRVMQGATAAGRVEVSLTAGIAGDWAGDWDALPDPLRQGVVRLAAHLFGQSASDAPPAIVTALWRPWRRMRLA